MIETILDAASNDGRDCLLEPEGLAVLAALGLRVSRHLFVHDRAEVAACDLSVLGSERVVVKVVSPGIVHKTDVGGVAAAACEPASVKAAIDRMALALASRDVRGFLLCEFIPYDRDLGNELLVGLRWTAEFGPVVTLGAGGVHAEFLAHYLRAGRDVALWSPSVAAVPDSDDTLRRAAIVELVSTRLRGQAPRLELDVLKEVISRLGALAALMPDRLSECEVNPFVIAAGQLVALDVLIKLRARAAAPSADPARPRPLHKLGHLLKPQSVAIAGVSERLNPGHVIVNNLLREGFDPARVYIIKPGSKGIEGCRSVPNLAALPERVDLLVLAIDAEQASRTLVDIIDGRHAESVVVIPGGLEEKAGGVALARLMRQALDRARTTTWQGPVINGGNSLGIRSRPGRYDTTFVPAYKRPALCGKPSPVAVISQSGAFAVAKASKLRAVNPKYSISVGNQMDLTIGDYLEYLKDDPEIDLFAVYVEGFRPLDGLRTMRLAAEITSTGRTVVLYRAGRTPEGAEASASHTASIAGDYAVTAALAQQAGVVVAESSQDFEDLTMLFAMLADRQVTGRRLGAISNAGFECVAIADNLGTFTLPPFGPATAARLQQVLRSCRIERVVDVHNPIDLTPMAGDEAYEEVLSALMDDDDLDAVVVGCVPLTPALNTLRAGEGHHEDLDRDDGLVARLGRVKSRTTKPWVVVVDAGALYDPLAERLLERGVPTFRTADRATAAFNRFCEIRLKSQTGRSSRSQLTAFSSQTSTLCAGHGHREPRRSLQELSCKPGTWPSVR